MVTPRKDRWRTGLIAVQHELYAVQHAGCQGRMLQCTKRLSGKDKYGFPAALTLRKCRISMIDFQLACSAPGILVL